MAQIVASITGSQKGSSRNSGKINYWPNAIVFIAVAFASMVTIADSQECSMDEFSKCMGSLGKLHLSPEFSIGVSKKEELDKLCQELRSGVSCVQSFTRRCLDLQSREQFNKMYSGSTQLIRYLCNEGKFQDEYLKHAHCSEKAKKEFEVCASRYRETMDFLKPRRGSSPSEGQQHQQQPQQQHQQTQQEENEELQKNEDTKTICCSTDQFIDCSEDAARKKCGDEAAKFTREVINRIVNSMTKGYCEDITRNPEKCAGAAIQQSWLFVTMSLVALLLVMGYQQQRMLRS